MIDMSVECSATIDNPCPKLSSHHGNGGGDYQGQRLVSISVKQCLLDMTAALTNSQRLWFPTQDKPVNILAWRGKGS